MRIQIAAGLVGAIVAMHLGQSSEAEPASSRPYPDAPRSDTVDDYHGTKIADPYRPLENPDAPETRAWIEAENKITGAFLESIPAARRDQEASDRTLELREVRHPRARGTSLLLHPQQRAPEPGGALHDRGP